MEEFILGYAVEGSVAGVIVFLLIKNFLPGYLSQKGKNLANSEDIEEITNKIEDIKTQNQTLLEGYKAKHQLRLAALDKRLEAHQQAFSLWRQLNGSLGQPEYLKEIVRTCDKWWGDNSLYLEPDSREAFLKAWVSARDMEYYQGTGDASLIQDAHKQLNAAGAIITRAVELPPLNETFEKL